MITADLAIKLMLFENGELNETETVELFSHLIKTGLAWTLQGFYGRAARSFIENGVLSETGEILDGPCSG